jgi:DNA-binding NarL/FixJ family response regulator
MLEDDPGIRVVAEASDGAAAVEAAGKFHPQVAVMDFQMPGMNGAVATRQVLQASPRTSVLMLSMHSEPSCVRTCLDAGAKGYLLKNAMDLDLVHAVRQVAAGEVILDPAIKAVSGPAEANAGLTTRELEVLQLIVNGRSNKEIAAELRLSVNTVAVHRANIMQALGIHNTAELVVYAIREGLVSIA